MKHFIRLSLTFLLMASSFSIHAKDNFFLTLLANRMRQAERFEEVDPKSFAGERTGFGLLIESGPFGDWSFEMGLLKASRQYTVIDNGHVVAEEVDRLHIPLGARYKLFKYLDVGLGGYGSFAVSKEERAVEDNAPSSESTSAQDDEYGVHYLLSAHAPYKTSEFILDLRYFEPSVSKNAEQTNNLMVSVGIKFKI